MDQENSTLHPRLTERVYRMIREDILSKKLIEGSRLTLNALAIEKGVSITPVREALVRLEKEGFIYTIPRGGTYIREISRKEIKDTYELRQAVEILGVRLAAKHIDEVQLAELQNNCNLYAKYIKKMQINLCVDADIQFHYLIAKASGNEKLLSVMEELLFRIALMISRGNDYWNRAEASFLDHTNICQALKKHDADAAAAIIGDHMRRGKESLFELE